jgi:hypothetical protein
MSAKAPLYKGPPVVVMSAAMAVVCRRVSWSATLTGLTFLIITTPDSVGYSSRSRIDWDPPTLIKCPDSGLGDQLALKVGSGDRTVLAGNRPLLAHDRTQLAIYS